MIGAPSRVAYPTQTADDRAAARRAGQDYASQRDRMIQQAREQRVQPAQLGYSRPPSHRSSSQDAQMASRLAAEEARRAGLY